MTLTSLREVCTNLTHPGATLKRYNSSGRRFKGRVFAIQGLVAIPLVAFKHTVAVAHSVVMERIFYHIIDGVAVQPRRPTSGAVKAALLPTFDAFCRVAPFVAVWSFDDFVNSVHGRKHRLYDNCVKRLEKGWTWGDVSRWSRFRAFIKHEKLPVVATKRLVPRLIQPRSPEYNVLVGRYIKAAEKPIFAALGQLSGDVGPVVAKGLDVHQLAGVIVAKWTRFINPVAIGFDQSRFDQHISVAALEFEHGFYHRIFRSHELRKLLRYQLSCHGVVGCSDGHVKYDTEGCRGSGDMNTGLGNSIIQFALMHSYASSLNLQNSISYLVNGDDSLIICEKAAAPLFNGFASFCDDLGFVLKVEPLVDVCEKISFCQMQPVHLDTGWTMVRAFPTAVNKDVVTTFALTPSNFLRYYAAVGECGLALSTGVPVYQAFYSYLRGLAEPLSLSEEVGGMFFWKGNLDPKVAPVTDQARFSFYLAFGVLPEHQIAIEQSYRKLPVPLWDGISETQPIPNVDLGVRQGV